MAGRTKAEAKEEEKGMEVGWLRYGRLRVVQKAMLFYPESMGYQSGCQNSLEVYVTESESYVNLFGEFS